MVRRFYLGLASSSLCWGVMSGVAAYAQSSDLAVQVPPVEIAAPTQTSPPILATAQAAIQGAAAVAPPETSASVLISSQKPISRSVQISNSIDPAERSLNPSRQIGERESQKLFGDISDNRAADGTASSDMGQVTSVSQLSDIRPTDWAYQALQSLVERYGCFAGYPNQTFRGNRTLSRYEFAAGLNACLDRLTERIADLGEGPVSQTDLMMAIRLQEEFAAELGIVGQRLDDLQARAAVLEAQQFSSTTKLSGEASIILTDAIGASSITNFGEAPTRGVGTNATLQYRVQLEFNSSFSGRDRLRTRLQMGNSVPALTSGPGNPAVLLYANEGRLAQDNTTNAFNNGSVYLDLLEYTTPIGNNLRIHLFANAGFHYQYADTVNPFLDDQEGGNGAVSRFGQRNPIFNLIGNNGANVSGGAGLGITYRLSNSLRLQAGYLASRANDPSSSAGLFGGNYSALAQVMFQPSDRLKIGLTYVNAYNAPGSFRFGGAGTAVGSFRANLLFPVAPTSALGSAPIVSNSYGAQVSFRVNPKFTIGGWVGYTHTRLIGYGDGDIWNYALTLTFPDLVRQGALGGIIIGAEPTLRGLRSTVAPVPLPNRDFSYHIEAFYRYQFTDQISVTPSIIWLPAVNQRGANSDVFIGTLRTTFTF